MTQDEAEGIAWDFIMSVTDAERFSNKPSYQQDKEEFRKCLVTALQFAPKSIFAAQGRLF
jgi:hypothetical protein